MNPATVVMATTSSSGEASAVRSATAEAFRHAARSAGPVLLEPVVSVEVVVPEGARIAGRHHHGPSQALCQF